ncbi:MAG: hypothetical protein ACR2PT_07300 [Endozoicomonas sp.]
MKKVTTFAIFLFVSFSAHCLPLGKLPSWTSVLFGWYFIESTTFAFMPTEEHFRLSEIGIIGSPRSSGDFKDEAMGHSGNEPTYDPAAMKQHSDEMVKHFKEKLTKKGEKFFDDGYGTMIMGLSESDLFDMAKNAMLTVQKSVSADEKKGTLVSGIKFSLPFFLDEMATDATINAARYYLSGAHPYFPLSEQIEEKFLAEKATILLRSLCLPTPPMEDPYKVWGCYDKDLPENAVLEAVSRVYSRAKLDQFLSQRGSQEFERLQEITYSLSFYHITPVIEDLKDVERILSTIANALHLIHTFYITVANHSIESRWSLPIEAIVYNTAKEYIPELLRLYEEVMSL